MRKTIFISPRVKTYETDKSDKKSPWAKEQPVTPGTTPTPQEAGGGTTQVKNFIILENGFYLLQEDNGKFII